MVGELSGVRAASPFATIAEAIVEFQAGRFVLIVDDEDRENEGDLVIAAEFCGASQINFMVSLYWVSDSTSSRFR
jgi:3,4-dihydroxy-2-butanone 4-phosphate synthase